MKIQYLIDSLLSPSLSALNFVDRYAGMTRVMNILIDSGDDKATQKRYPIACDVTAKDCNNTGIYQNLVPNDSKNSVVYWEEVSPMKNTGYTAQKDFYTKDFQGVARLVVWLNLNRLGISDCKRAIETVPPIEKIITTKGKFVSGIYENDFFWIEPSGFVKKDPKSIFGKYTYPINNQYYLYPFDYYAIDVKFKLHQCLKRGQEFILNPSTDCINTI
ncbi:hypothetical protein AB832_07980 [Flavobacteriaceae bacterium (ex Bugula neritina AB1)]|nr:hypothetical protein AB832_07980 [Flavobacteriaceae bacterium (ex Bugula neritina AB1)]